MRAHAPGHLPAPGRRRAASPARCAATRSSPSPTAPCVDRLGGGRPQPADGAVLSARRRHAAGAGRRGRGRSSASASTTPRTPPRRARAARAADRLHEAPDRSCVPPGGPVRCPRVVERLDYEAELVGRDRRRRPIAGYAVADDVSARDLQKREPQWTRAKGFDTSCPWGPWITTADEVPDPRGAAHSAHGSTASRARTRPRRPDLRSAGAGRLHRGDDHARARRHHPHRHAEPASARRFDPPQLPRRRRRRPRSRSRGSARSSTRSRFPEGVAPQVASTSRPSIPRRPAVLSQSGEVVRVGSLHILQRARQHALALRRERQVARPGVGGVRCAGDQATRLELAPT